MKRRLLEAEENVSLIEHGELQSKQADKKDKKEFPKMRRCKESCVTTPNETTVT